MCLSVCLTAKRREDRKKTKYEQELLPGGSAPNTIPLVYEHFGHWGSEAESFLCHLTKKSRNVEGQQNTVEFLNYWRRLSQSLCKDAMLKWC